jgi:hypothetical protein
MGKFEVVKLSDEAYDFLVIATSYENPLDLYNEIEQEIKVEKARILFDLTLLNGLHENRYIACDYVGSNIFSSSYSIANNVSESIKSVSNKYFKQHEDIVQESIIPKALKFLLTKTDLVK